MHAHFILAQSDRALTGTPILQVKEPRPGDCITYPHHPANWQQQPNGLALTGLISKQRRQVEEGHILLFIPCAPVLFKFAINRRSSYITF